MPLYNSAPLLSVERQPQRRLLFNSAPLLGEPVDESRYEIPLGFLAGKTIYESRRYVVCYSGSVVPPYSGATWHFTHRGRGGSFHGFIVDHPNGQVARKVADLDVYILPRVFGGKVTEVSA